MRKFKFADDTSYKFWNIELHHTSFTVTYGRIGSQGQTQTKEFDTVEKAQRAYDKLIAEKMGKGYVEITVKAAAPASTENVLERAIVADPNDLAAHSAYADWLSQQGDPRGEFIQVQLLLEDPARPPKERKELQKREQELLEEHGESWLGDLGRFLHGTWSGANKPYHYEFARGWLDVVRMLPVPEAVFAALAQSPEARLLRRLEIVYDMRYHPFDFDEFMEGPNNALKEDEQGGEIYEGSTIMPPLLASPYLTNLRVFKLGFSDGDDRPGHSTMVAPFENCDVQQVIELPQKCPRLEELYLNTALPGIDSLFALPKLQNIRVLQYDYATGYTSNAQSAPYPLSALANNASLKNLTALRLHPGRDATIELDNLDAILKSSHLQSLAQLQVHMTTFGDAGCRSIVESGILRRLKVLDIGYGNMTDEGARLLAASPDLKNLEELIVTRNALTTKGIAALQATGVQVVADNQHEPDEEDFLYEVDFE